MAAADPRIASRPPLSAPPRGEHYFNLRLGRWLTAEAGGLGVAGAVVALLALAACLILFQP